MRRHFTTAALFLAALLGCSCSSKKKAEPGEPPAANKGGEDDRIAEALARIGIAEKDEEPLTEWAGLGKDNRLGDVTVRIDEVSLGKAKSADGRLSRETQLVFAFTVANGSRTRKIDYLAEYGRLGDELGNLYKGVFSLDKPAGATQQDSLYPGKQLSDVLLYEVPVDAAKRLDWKVPGKRYGEKGTFRFRVPIEAVKRR